MAGDHADAQGVAGGVGGVPEGGQLVFVHVGRQVEIDRHVARAQARGGHVGRDDVHREPGRALPAVRRHHEERIRRQGHHLATAQIDDSAVDPVLRPDQHARIGASQAALDDVIKESRVNLAHGGQLRHGHGDSSTVLGANTGTRAWIAPGVHATPSAGLNQIRFKGCVLRPAQAGHPRAIQAQRAGQAGRCQAAGLGGAMGAGSS